MRADLPLDVVHRGVSPDEAAIVVVAVHGRDQSPRFMVDAVVARIPDDDICWLLPAAPAGQWYTVRAADRDARDDAAVHSALDRLVSLAAKAAASSKPVVWTGFSQGACLAIEAMARTPGVGAGVVAMTGALIGGRIGARHLGDMSGVPVRLSAGRDDPWLPGAHLSDTAAAFRRAGADVVVERFDDGDHVVRPSEVATLAGVIDIVRRR